MAGIPNPMLWSSPDPLDELGKIQRSVRPRPLASARFERTPPVAGNQKKWTFHGAVRRCFVQAAGALPPNSFILGGGSGVTNYSYFGFANNFANTSGVVSDGLECNFVVGNGQVGRLMTNRRFRDPSAHYFLTLVIDTAQSIPSDRFKIFVDDVRETDFAIALWPSQNADMPWLNSNTLHALGSLAAYPGYYFDGNLSQLCFVDGQALDPAAFGRRHPRTGQWRPKTPAAIRAAVAAGGGARNGWGVNGFFLPFDDVTSLTSLGYDRSQSDTDAAGNNWSPVNISLTAGATNDALMDTPTDVFCTWSALAPGDSAKSNGNLTAAGTARGTMDASSSPFQWEITANAGGVVGGAVSEAGTTSTVAIPSGSIYGFRLGGGALDYTADGLLWTSIATGLTGVRFPYASGGSNTLNCGQRPAAYPLSPGFRRLSTKSLSLFSGAVATSGTFVGNLSADGPAVFMGGAPETLTINGNPVTWGVHADRLATGFKVRSASSSYNNSGSNAWAATIQSPSVKSLFRYQNAQEN